MPGNTYSSAAIFQSQAGQHRKESEACWAICYIIVNNLENLGEQGWGSKDDEAFKQNRLLPCSQKKEGRDNML
jgi:hypothetical protein